MYAYKESNLVYLTLNLFKKKQKCLHAYIKSPNTPLNKGNFCKLSLHKAYIIPTSCLHKTYIIPTWFLHDSNTKFTNILLWEDIQLEFSKLWPQAKSSPLPFCTWSFNGKQPHLFIYIMLRAVLVSQGQSWVGATESEGPKIEKYLLSIWPLTERKLLTLY